MEVVKYDKLGRMQYNPELHTNHKKPWTVDELEYLCKFYYIDGPKTISLALGKTEKTISRVIYQLKKDSLYEHYRNLNLFYVSVN